ncbi:MAG: hypothetical protein GXX95_06400 [Methanomassiliicoccus sp.]|nr:hypothetical protein [Methanomassiliicoccus sp.]
MDMVMMAGAARIQRLREEFPDTAFEDDYMDTEVGTRGLIRRLDPRGEVTELEFIEPEAFWADPDAVEEYSETLGMGIKVTVLVSASEALEAEAFLREEVGGGITVLAYEDGKRPGKNR